MDFLGCIFGTALLLLKLSTALLMMHINKANTVMETLQVFGTFQALVRQA